MRKISALRAVVVGIPLVALAGCGTGATDSAEPAAGSSAQASARAEAPAATATAAKTLPRDADPSPPAAKTIANEVPAPESSQAHTPIDDADAAKLRASIERPAQAAQPEEKADIAIFCPLCPRIPDLTVVEDDRDQWLYDPSYGWYQGYAKGFDIENIGLGNAGTFHVAVIQDSTSSYGFDVPGLAAGQSIYYQITNPSYLGPACGVNALVLLNPFDAITETNYSNNATTIAGYCFF